jgi:hypothetical protein
MTLAEHTLAKIKTDWDGTFPSDLKRVNRDDSVVLEDGPGFGYSFGDSFGEDRAGPSVSEPLEDANLVGAATATRTSQQTGVGVDRIEQVVELRIEGLDNTQYGQIETTSEFQQLVDDIKQVFRTSRFEPGVGPRDPATFVRVEVEGEDSQSSQYGDAYVAEFELRYIGERT